MDLDEEEEEEPEKQECGEEEEKILRNKENGFYEAGRRERT